jgi:hypothetical protein
LDSGEIDSASAPAVFILPPSPTSSIAAVTAEMKTGDLSVFDSQLSKLYLESVHSPEAAAFASVVHDLPGTLQSIGRHTFVTIDVVAKNGKGASLLPQLQQIGLRDAESFKGVVSGSIDVNNLGQLQALLGGKSPGKADDIGSASVSKLIAFAGSVDNQADHASLEDQARQNLGFDGTGVTVGIISDSFDTAASAATHMAQDIASGDLPASTTILQDYPNGTDEGRAMAQIVHDVAPGASILFDTGEGGQAQMANAIVALANAGAKIIVDDLGYFRELYYQEGPIAQAVDQVAAQGVAYFSAAGNDANNGAGTGYERPWTPGAYDCAMLGRQ